MVKLKGPGMASKAAGGLGKVLIFSESKGRPYAKRWSAPANPQTGGQIGVRAIVQWVSENWRLWPEDDRLTWEALAHQKRISPINACIGYNLERISRMQYPASNYPARRVLIPQTWFHWDIRNYPGGLILDFYSDAANDGRGWILHRANTDKARLPDNFVKVVPCYPWQGLTTLHDRLPSGTYFYKARRLASDSTTFGQLNYGPYVVP